MGFSQIGGDGRARIGGDWILKGFLLFICAGKFNF
jgi:hypothetical protein